MPPETQAPAQVAQSAEWRILCAAAGLPDITHATRVVQLRDDVDKPWMGGWRVMTSEGPMLVTDDLAIQWEGSLYEERVPVQHRVPLDHYADAPRPRGPALNREPFKELRLPAPFPQWHDASADEHFDRLAAYHELPWVPYHLPSRARWNVVQVAHIRWAEMKGRTDVARLLSERHAEATTDIALLREQLVEWLLARGKWGMLHGMSREQAAKLWSRALSLEPTTPELREELVDLLARIGRDPPPLPAAPTAADWIAHLPEDMAFPEARWTPVMRGTSPWISGLQPKSPAWELVALGWPALPMLREVMRSDQVLRHGGPSTDEWGGPAVILPDTLGPLALAVASTIAQQPFETPEAFETWWNDTGHRGAPARAGERIRPKNSRPPTRAPSRKRARR